MRKTFQNLTCRKNSNSKSNALYFFPNQNLMRCIIFILKFNYIQNLLFKSSFQILSELSSKCCQHQRTTCWIMTMACVKKTFYECVACVCLTFCTIFLVIASFMALGFLVGVMTISFALPIDLYKSLWKSEKG